MRLITFIGLLAILVATVSASPFIKKGDTDTFPQRIPVGSEARKGEFPYIVQIRRGGAYCTGSIVNENWIVTTAHCSVASISGYTVIAGEHNLNVDEGTEQTRSVAQIVRHPAYNSNTLANDIAVWRLTSPFTFDTWVQAANIAPPGFEPSPQLQVAGWWDRSVLMKVTVPLISDAECRANYGSDIRPGMFCAGTGPYCQGNSGGPVVVVSGTTTTTLVGLVGWGYGCGDPRYPGVNTDVAYYSSWIRSNIM